LARQSTIGRSWCKSIALALAGILALALIEPLAAQGTGRSFSSRSGSLYRQGLPPATMFDSTGRSPGSLSRRVTTPTAPYIIPPANPNLSGYRWGTKLPPPRQRVR
jgi:hypothetical protein